MLINQLEKSYCLKMTESSGREISFLEGSPYNLEMGLEIVQDKLNTKFLIIVWDETTITHKVSAVFLYFKVL